MIDSSLSAGQHFWQESEDFSKCAPRLTVFFFPPYFPFFSSHLIYWFFAFTIYPATFKFSLLNPCFKSLSFIY